MAKISLNKLDLKKNLEVIELHHNEQVIEVKQYLPVEEKLEMFSDILSKSIDENNFANTPKREIFTAIDIIKYYTNINFTDKQMEDICKTYDLVVGNGVYGAIRNAIPAEELNFITNSLNMIFKDYYEYKTSALGIMESITRNYNNLNFDAEEIQKNIADPNNLELLKEVLTKLG